MASLHLAQEIFKLIYPVGSIYLSTSTTNPSTYFGGTWEQVAKECYLLGYNSSNTWFDKPGQSKGSKSGPGGWNTGSTTLTIDQIPSHKHPFRVVKERQDQITGGEHASNLPVASRTNGDNIGWSNFANDTAVGSSGGGKGHNHFHVLPYYTVVVWKRTA